MHSATSAAEEIRTHTFDHLPLAPFLQETIKAIGYTQPTPIQAEAIPLVCEGRDLIGLAQTGTGKTAAFVLPILQRLSGSKQKGAKALVLAPTRELAEQINDVIKELSPRTGLKSVTIYGGVSHGRQISDLRGRPQIIVACPGRLLDHIGGRTVDLSGIEVLVLDEADRMCDMGFLPDIKKIIKALPTERQTLLFSATMPPEIQELTRGIQNDPAIVRVKMESPVASVSHAMYQIKQQSKPGVLSHWLQENRSALVVVFTKMKHTAKRLAEQLEKRGELATSLHGNLSQAKRQRALSGFKDGRYRVLIATDIAARGIDVKGITHVVNYDMPENLDDYIHRTGRAGRASATGEAVSFVTKADGSLLRSIERWLNGPVARLEAPEVEGVEAEEVSTSDTRSSARGRGRQTRSRSGGRPDRRQREGREGREGRERRGERRPRRDDQQSGTDSESPRMSRPERREAPSEPRGERSRGPREERGGRFTRDRGDRGPRDRSRSERPSRGFDRGERPTRDFNRGERSPRYAFGPEQGSTESRPRTERSGDRRERRGGDRGQERRRSSFPREERRDRGQPRDRFASLEGPDLSQVDALKVLERKERFGGGDRDGRRPRGGGSGGRRPRFGGGRPQKPNREGRRSWDR